MRVLANCGVMLIAWFAFPGNWLFDFHGALALPMVLACWMVSDVSATNVLGLEQAAALGALDDRAALRRFLYSRHIVLWLLVAPVCMVVAIGIGVSEQHWLATFMTVVVIMIVPVAATGLAAMVGVWFPYHPRPLMWRWRNRRRFRPVILRWSVLALAPSWLVTVATVIVMLPAVAMWGALSGWKYEQVGDAAFVAGAAIACLSAIGWRILANRAVIAIALRRRAELARYLADPDRG